MTDLSHPKFPFAIAGFYRLELRCSAVQRVNTLTMAPPGCALGAQIDAPSRCLALRAATQQGWRYSEHRQQAFCINCAPGNPIKGTRGSRR